MKRLLRRSRLLILVGLAVVISLTMGPLMLSSNQTAARGSGSVVAQGNPPPPTLAPTLPMVSGQYEDPQGRFQVGILDGYQVSTVANAPLLQAPDGSLAYTVAVSPLPPDRAALSEAELVAMAEQTFRHGEGFLLGPPQPIAGNGVQISWTGRLTQGNAPPQPIAGQIYARQRGDSIFLLLVAATDAAQAQVNDAIAALGSTLTVP
ncbi:hypothetical protein [Nodosilinea sp. P-1105]|uniref:hypothetical protein n=1 Tax=Nodosilinea sp. P-1105 TaxID=2546229 RepID=UPI00146D511E|nr:hypothetical protein [Nodosilinea sp. P-1105]NMF82840.1 hypothetical protein [Nodosilinea sp. P-1105]